MRRFMTRLLLALREQRSKILARIFLTSVNRIFRTKRKRKICKPLKVLRGSSKIHPTESVTTANITHPFRAVYLTRSVGKAKKFHGAIVLLLIGFLILFLVMCLLL